jgi:hypothetical protein
MPEEELKEEQLRLQFRKCGGEGEWTAARE